MGFCILKKINGSLAVLSGVAGIFAILAFSFDVLDLGLAKSVKVVDMPRVQLDTQELTKLHNIIADNRDRAVTAISKKRTILLSNMDTVKVERANVNIGVMFNTALGKNFAKLTISPSEKRPVSLPVYNSGQYIEFDSNTGEHIATVLNIDFRHQNIEVDVSKID